MLSSSLGLRLLFLWGASFTAFPPFPARPSSIAKVSSRALVSGPFLDSASNTSSSHCCSLSGTANPLNILVFFSTSSRMLLSSWVCVVVAVERTFAVLLWLGCMVRMSRSILSTRLGGKSTPISSNLAWNWGSDWHCECCAITNSATVWLWIPRWFCSSDVTFDTNESNSREARSSIIANVFNTSRSETAQDQIDYLQVTLTHSWIYGSIAAPREMRQSKRDAATND